MTFWSETVQRSRKMRQCAECHCEISIGESYTRGAGISVDGEFGVYITHSDCLAATREQHTLANLGYDEWWPMHEWVWELPQDALNTFSQDYPNCYARVASSLLKHGRAAVISKAKVEG